MAGPADEAAGGGAGVPVDAGPTGDRGRPDSGAAPGPDGLRVRERSLRSSRTPFVQATVVRALRPTSAKAGDRALVLPDGAIEGFVGGTCAESSVRVQSLRVLRSHEPVVLRIIPEGPPEPVVPGAGPPPGAEVGASRAEGLVTVNNPCASGGMLEIFLEGVFPPPLVQVCGEAPIARALRDVGRALGYDIRPAAADQDPVEPDADAVVVASHGRDEEPVLAAALRAGAAYVGLVASRRRGAQVLASLDVPPEDRARVRTPAGLDIGARTPEEIALSIFAQIVRERPRHAPAGASGAAAAEPRPDAGNDVGGQAPGQEPGAGRAGPAPEGDAAAAPGPEAAGAAPGGGGLPGETTDPVCGMIVVMSEASPHLTHDGRMWYFCGPGCRQAFADDPARYARADDPSRRRG